MSEIVLYRRQAMTAARQLGYGKETEKRIKAAKSEAEITRIMISAREKKFK